MDFFKKAATVMGGCLGGAAVGANIEGGLGAAFASTGAAILKATGNKGYEVLEATQKVSAGGAVVGGVLGAVGGVYVGSLIANGLFHPEDTSKKQAAIALTSLIGVVPFVGSLIGQGFFLNSAASTMSIEQTLASTAVGEVVVCSGVALTVGLCVCLMMLEMIGELCCTKRNSGTCFSACC